jgi:uncharacterized membrane protein YcaP (DUF421 family)
MFIVFIRTAILYSLVVIVMRLMGKRQIGELQPYEFVITIMISDLAALPMQDTRFPLLLGIVPIITLLLLKNILSLLQLKSQYLRKIIDGEPTILVYKGKLNYLALKKQQINIDELMEEFRLSGFFDLEDIQYAILENNGQLSILPSNFKADKDSNTPRTSPKSKGPLLPKILVSDGKINKNSLTTISKDKAYIENILKTNNIDSIKKVLIAMYDSEGNFKYQLFNKFEEENSK